MAKRFKVLGFYRESCYAQGKFRKKYEKDEIVVAVPGTLGIMTFKSLKEAREFQRCRNRTCPLIVAVEPVGRGKVPKKISSVPEHLMESFYAEGPGDSGWGYPPKGTICYPAVLVLE